VYTLNFFNLENVEKELAETLFVFLNLNKGLPFCAKAGTITFTNRQSVKGPYNNEDVSLVKEIHHPETTGIVLIINLGKSNRCLHLFVHSEDPQGLYDKLPHSKKRISKAGTKPAKSAS
jgi:hypothetical protein